MPWKEHSEKSTEGIEDSSLFPRLFHISDRKILVGLLYRRRPSVLDEWVLGQL